MTLPVNYLLFKEIEMKIIIQAGLVLTALTLVCGVALSSGRANAPVVQDGGALYAQACASCHGRDGKAQTRKGRRLGATNFTKTAVPEAKAVRTITNGKGEMPSYKESFSDAEIKAVAAYVRGFKK
jgi:mono/diheme cytochrome c family protein